MSALLSFFTSSWVKYAVILAAIAAFSAFIWHKGDQHGSAKLTAYKASQANIAAKIVVKQAEVTTQVVTEYIHDTRVIREKAQVIIKEVPVYVTKQDDARCTINNGFVQLWNYSNSGTVPPAPTRTDDSPSAVKLSDVAIEHAKEVEQYNETAERLKALQEWVAAQRKVSS